MSIVIVAFAGAPEVSEDAIKKEKDLDERIEVKIKGTCRLKQYSCEESSNRKVEDHKIITTL